MMHGARKLRLHLNSPKPLFIYVDGVKYRAARIIKLAPHEAVEVMLRVKARPSPGDIQRAAAGELTEREWRTVEEGVEFLFSKIFPSIPRNVAVKIGGAAKQEAVHAVIEASHVAVS